MSDKHLYIGHIIFNHSLYGIAAHDKESIIRPSDYGIEFEEPLQYMRYSDLYELCDNKLILNGIRIDNGYGTFPLINGKRAIPKFGAIIYKMLELPVAYTGTIIIKRGYNQIGERNSLLTQLFGCSKLLMIVFENGKVVERKDMSRYCNEIKRLENNKAQLKENPTGLEALFLRDYPLTRIVERDALYKYYSEYFEV